MLRLVLFDFDGVISDSEPAHFEIFRRVLRQEGIEIEWDAYCEKYLGFDDLEGFAHILADFGRAASPELVDQLANRKCVQFAEHLKAGKRAEH